MKATPPVVVALVLANGLLLGGCGADSASVEIEGEWHPVRGAAPGTPPERPHLKIEEDGDFVGSDGCNGMGGSLDMTGTRVDLEGYRTTSMGCSGQVDFERLLQSAETAKRDGANLIFLDSDGQPALELEPD